jgi:hypothetical protein
LAAVTQRPGSAETSLYPSIGNSAIREQAVAKLEKLRGHAWEWRFVGEVALLRKGNFG